MERCVRTMQLSDLGNMSIYLTIRTLLALSISISAGAQADTLYKCRDESGAVLYTNQKGSARRCTVLSSDQPITTIPAPRQAARNATPGDFPRVDGDTQRGRDGDRRAL